MSTKLNCGALMEVDYRCWQVSVSCLTFVDKRNVVSHKKTMLHRARRRNSTNILYFLTIFRNNVHYCVRKTKQILCFKDDFTFSVLFLQRYRKSILTIVAWSILTVCITISMFHMGFTVFIVFIVFTVFMVFIVFIVFMFVPSVPFFS